MNKVWKVSLKKSDDLVEQLYINRGLVGKEREKFINPKVSDYEKNLKIPGISKAAAILRKVITEGDKIVVYGDYDVDGVCATAVVYKALKSLGAKIVPYIPHREKEGYGLSKVGLDFVKSTGASLVVTVDQGIGAKQMAEYARKIGLDLIITDHHSLDKTVPHALAIVHTTQMCGTAVAWCLMSAMVKKELSDELLEFVALATVCDLMPLLGVNRALVAEGLKRINQTRCLGLKALIKEAGIEGRVDAYDLGHYLGPRLNAAGRLEHAMDALKLLCTKEPLKASRLAKALTDANVRRQELTKMALEEARGLIDLQENVHVLYSSNWIPGIVGLVAGRIAEETGKPTVAISMGETTSKGSARSGNEINIIETIRRVKHLLVDVGGHKGAAGFTIETKKIEEFKVKLGSVLESVSVRERALEIEAVIPANKVTKSLALDIAKFEPFGLGNPPPLLGSEAIVVSDLRTVGNGRHLKFKAGDIDAIGFGMGDIKDFLRTGQEVSLAYYLEINRFRNLDKPQLRVVDIKF